MSSTKKTCLRCHSKKIRCTGFPDCEKCDRVSVRCERYSRPRKSETVDALIRAQRRIKWLEDELRQHFGVECGGVSTGTPLRSSEQPSTDVSQEACDVTASAEDESMREPSQPRDATPTPANAAPELSLLALNATGELKYLGPSSGTFFASYATAIARSFAERRNPLHSLSIGPGDPGCETTIVGEEQASYCLTAKDARLLLTSYQMWVQPLYPMFETKSLDELVEACLSESSVESSDMAIFYLVMALGANNCSNTINEMQVRGQDKARPMSIDPILTPSFLYSNGLQYLVGNVTSLRSRIATIQMLVLICIYSSYGPVGSSQWQLSGLAMRMAIEIGLHYTPETRQLPQADRELGQKARVFWCAYAIEICLAYNLGRPPSIAEEHITTKLADLGSNVSLGVHHIRHRQIQSRIVSRVYRGRGIRGAVSEEEKQAVVSELQAELDEWKLQLLTIYELDMTSPYPLGYWERLYHGTSFVLHRSSPLCPQPAAQSLSRCIRSAGGYLACMAEVLRSSNVPLSWMLVQGVLFAGLTMLVTARTNVHVLATHAGIAFLLVDLPSWTRKCSVCLSIVNERWKEELLSKLDTQFELLANDTLRVISNSLTQGRAQGSHQARTLANPSGGGQAQSLPSQVQEESDLGVNLTDEVGGGTDDWENFQFFREFLGIDYGVQTFWDILAADGDGNGAAGQGLSMPF